MQVHGLDYRTHEPICVHIDGTQIRRVESAWHPNASNWPLISPGLFDLQINGHGGTWFGSENITPDKVIQTIEPHYRFGITRLCPTLITNSFTALQNGFDAIRRACEQERWVDSMVPGCHLEGPFISSVDGPRGAHPIEHVRPADWDEFQKLQEAAGGRIRLVTLAPEVDGAIEFIRLAVNDGIVISIGHTAADADDIKAAVDAGARLSTHLGNGAHGTIRRHPNYIWEQLGESRLCASLISDGFHLPSSVLQTMMRTKGPLRTILTCDAAGLAGCKPGVYAEGSVDVEILEDGRIVIAGQRQLLAGSSVETDTCISGAVRLGGASLAEAIDMASGNPARLLGFEETRLQRGSTADLVVFEFGDDSRMKIHATIAAGEIRFGRVSNPDG